MIKTILKLFYFVACFFVSTYLINMFSNAHLHPLGKGIYIVSTIIFFYGTAAMLLWHKHEENK